MANHGTVFLDEIGEIDKRMQALLLRVLQEKEVRRVGGEKVIPIDVRVIAATNQDLYEAVLDGKFRNDLYFRLPALRKRREDIPLLVESLIGELDRRLGCRVSGVDGEILQVLREYNWPGNVRELRNTLEKIVALTREGVARRLYNVFEDVLEPRRLAEINEIKSILIDCGALGASMSGSGPSVFGLFADRDRAQEACDRLRNSYRDVFLCAPAGPNV